MARSLMQTLVGYLPAAARKRLARKRRLRAIRPSHAAELQYLAGLLGVVGECKQAGEDVAAGMRANWAMLEHVRGAGDALALDERAHGLGALLGLAAQRLASAVGTRAQRLAQKIASLALGSVDETLILRIQVSLGIDISSYLTIDSEIGAAMKRAAVANVDLIKSIPAQYLDGIRAVVEKSWSEGLRWEAMVEKIQHEGDVAESRAHLIARDQASKMNAAFNEVRQTSIGITQYVWSTAHDERVRASHRQMDGTTQAWSAPPEVDGENVNPGEAVNCRCAAVPVLNIVADPAAAEAEPERQAA